ncbi:MAG: IS630 family transposase [Acetatifactor sp.]|nr:IS630 family transposase [Acetatifactor sp.]
MKCKKETDYRTVDPQAVYELKKVALRLRRKGKKVREICEITGLADKTVRMAFAAYDGGGINAIKPKKRGRKAGEKRTLSREQEQEITTLLVDHDPAQLKLKGCMWTRDSIKELIQQKYGISMPNRTVGEYLQRWGFTVQRPAKREANQKPEQVEAWLNEEYPEIHRKAKAENAEIFWGDETAVQNVANYARGYAPKGQTPVVKVQAKKMHINMISAISNRGELRFLLYSEAINSERLIGFMEALVKTAAGRKVYFILDNLRVHHSKLVSQWVDGHKEKIALFHLPPYSPEYNPDEYLNNDLKQSIGSQAMVQDIQELEANTSAFMDRLSDGPDHVKAYFDHPYLVKYKLG